MIECEPALNAPIEYVAWPLLMLPVPKVVAPSLNVTVPVGVPLPGDVTEIVAVKVTDWPITEGFTDDESETAVSALFTVCGKAELVLPLKLISPAYSAVIECEPGSSVAKQDAAPLSPGTNV